MRYQAKFSREDLLLWLYRDTEHPIEREQGVEDDNEAGYDYQ
jgi:hypothetical protein